MEIISHKDAKAQSLRFYFTGKPCLKCGNLCELYVCNANCVECARIRNTAWYAANRELSKANCKAWRLANPERDKAIVKAWCLANPDKERCHHRPLSRRQVASLSAVGEVLPSNHGSS